MRIVLINHFTMTTLIRSLWWRPKSPFEADGTIRSRDAIAWCVQELVRNARHAEVAETWWNLKK